MMGNVFNFDQKKNYTVSSTGQKIDAVSTKRNKEIRPPVHMYLYPYVLLIRLADISRPHFTTSHL